MSTNFARVKYENIRGVDFSNNQNNVKNYRSPDMVNMWKNYKSVNVASLEKSPNLRFIIDTDEENINGVYEYLEYKIFHVGKALKYISYSDGVATLIDILSEDDNFNIEDKKSKGFVFDDTLYLLDTKNYIKIYEKNNSLTCDFVSSDSYVPTTSINRTPDGLNFKAYEKINILSNKRINTFIADGVSVNYYLDTKNINDIAQIKIDGVISNNYTFNASSGVVTFLVAPQKSEYESNVSIQYIKNIEAELLKRVNEASNAVIFDNRVFFSGSNKYKNNIFHTELLRADYICDLNYYTDGINSNKISSLLVSGGLLYAFKNATNESTIYTHTPTLNYEYGKIYPFKDSGINLRVYNAAIFGDEVIFISDSGVYSFLAGRTIHKSSNIDKKFINEDLEDAKILKYKNYLFIAFKNSIYIANSKDTFVSKGDVEYEWFYFKIPFTINDLYLLDGEIYISSENQLYIFDETADLKKEENIYLKGYITTNKADLGLMTKYKSANKRGCIFVYNVMPNSACKLYVKSDKTNDEWEEIGSFATTGFDFNEIDFNEFAFSTSFENYRIVKLRQKKYKYLIFKIESDNSNFSIVSFEYEAGTLGYVKR